MRTTTWIGILLAVWLAWSALGVHPVAVLEGDGAAIATSAQRWAEQGPEALENAYRYEMQSGTYVVLMLLARVLGVDALVVFGILSAVASAALILFSGRWISMRTGLSFPASGLLVMLLPETWISAYYPNSTVLAAALVVISFNLLAEAGRLRSATVRGTEERGAGPCFWPTLLATKFANGPKKGPDPDRPLCGCFRWLLAGGAVFGLACWVRFDAVVVAPAVPLVLAPGDWATKSRQSAIVAVVAAATAVVGMIASGAGLSELAGSYLRHRGAAGSWALTVKSLVAFFPLVVAFLMALGTWRIVAERRGRDAALVLLGVLPLAFLLRSSLTTPKYLLYAAPLVALVAGHGLIALGGSVGARKKVLASAAVVLFAVQYPLGLQIEHVQGYRPTPHPTLLRIASVEIDRSGPERVVLVVGAGATISTHDALRLSSGILFGNGTWHYYKHESAVAAATLIDVVASGSAGTTDLWVEEPWEAGQLVEHALIRAGYRRRFAGPGDLQQTWEHGGRRVRLLCGDEGLRLAASANETRPLAAFVMWNNRLPPTLQQRFPDAERLTGPRASLNVYRLKPGD